MLSYLQTVYLQLGEKSMVRALITTTIKNVLACGIWPGCRNERAKPLLMLCVVAFPIGIRAYIRGVSTKLVY